jgi:hypothetical protein
MKSTNLYRRLTSAEKRMSMLSASSLKLRGKNGPNFEQSETDDRFPARIDHDPRLASAQTLVPV